MGCMEPTPVVKNSRKPLPKTKLALKTIPEESPSEIEESIEERIFRFTNPEENNERKKTNNFQLVANSLIIKDKEEVRVAEKDTNEWDNYKFGDGSAKTMETVDEENKQGYEIGLV